MSGAGFVLTINLAVSGLFALAFLTLAAHYKASSAALWFAGGYGLAIAYFVLEFILPYQANPYPVVLAAFGAFLGALMLAVVGIARRYRVSAPWQALLAVGAFSLALNAYGLTLPRASFARQMAYQFPYFLTEGLAALTILRSRQRSGLDLIFFTVIGLSACHYLAKPFIAQIVGGVGNSPQAYVFSQYALFSQATGAVLVVATGLCGLLMLSRDMLEEARRDSETDRLSGLCNRRGFEDRATPCLRLSHNVALVVSDLDGFKRINDSHGHESGDRVIQSFSAILTRSAPAGATCGRMGGEEFAILLPGANLAAARLFAETVRSAFAAIPVAGLGEERFTASFGLTVMEPGDTLSDMLRRADIALYKAKHAGRNCVCIAPATGQGNVWREPMALQQA